MTILVLAPHPDDESIGCGGTLRLHANRGDQVHALFLTSGELGLKELPRDKARAIREAEALRACKVLGILSAQFLRLPDWMMGDDLPAVAVSLAPHLAQIQPGLIYLPHPDEWHPDHKASLPALSTALKSAGFSPPLLRGYEVWTPLSHYDHVEDISATMPLKLRALRKHRSQIASWPYVRAIRGLNEYRGAMAGRCRYAEVFRNL